MNTRQPTWNNVDSERSVRVRLCGIGILPMRHGLEAHATVESSVRTESNPYNCAVARPERSPESLSPARRKTGRAGCGRHRVAMHAVFVAWASRP